MRSLQLAAAARRGDVSKACTLVIRYQPYTRL